MYFRSNQTSNLDPLPLRLQGDVTKHPREAGCRMGGLLGGGARCACGNGPGRAPANLPAVGLASFLSKSDSDFSHKEKENKKTEKHVQV